jgi:hypothetical protein
MPYRNISAIFAALFMSMSTAGAMPVTWDLEDVVFQNGETATGSFVYDADTNTFSNIDIVTPNATYGVPTGVGNSGSVLI